MDSGRALKSMVRTQLRDAEVSFEEHYMAGYKPGTAIPFYADFYIYGARCGIVSCVYQNVSGSAWEKQLYRYLCINKALFESALDFGYLVLFDKAEKNSPLLSMSQFVGLISVNKNIMVVPHTEFTRLVNRNELFKQNSARGLRKKTSRVARKLCRPNNNQPSL